MRTFLFCLFIFVVSSITFAQPGSGPQQHEPMHVKIIDNTAHQAIQVQSGWAGPISTHDIYQVPHDYIFVIEFVSFLATAQMWDCRLTTTVKGTLCSHYLSVIPQAKKGEPGVVSQMVKIYADPGSTVSMWAHTKENNTGMITISGYLVPL